MPNLVGKTLATRYKVEDFIGRGGMAEVYRVWDLQRSTRLAMKVLHEDLAIDRVFIRRFRREAQTLAKLQHPHIVRFYGLEQEGPHAFMLLDYIEGKTLKRMIFDQGGPVPLEHVETIFHSICTALQYAHTEGLIHCDMKPGNVMINRKGDVLVMDFGIARMTDAATATMVGMGTPAYMAPEQARGLDPVAQTDIYALGIILFEMLTGGERPFTGESAQTTGTTSERVRWEQINLKPPSPRNWNPNITPELETIVMKCLSKSPQDRYQTPLELLNDLERTLDAMGVAPSDRVYIPMDDFDASEAPTELEPLSPPIGQTTQFDRPKPIIKQPWFWAVAGVGLILVAMLFATLGDKPVPVAEAQAVAEEKESLGESASSGSQSSSTLPTYTALPTYTSAPTYTPPPTYTALPPMATPEPTREPTKTSRPPTNTPKPSGPPMLYMNKNFNCRGGAGSQYELLRTFSAGQRKEIIGKDGSGWWLVKINDPTTRKKQCWVGGGEVEGSTSNVPYSNWTGDGY